MLEVGNGHMTDEEYRAHFSLWAVAKAPLIVGCDVRNMTNATREILLNREIIAINQDPLGIQGKRVSNADGLSVWAGPLAGNSWGVVMLNTNTRAATFAAKWIDIGIPTDAQVKVRDLWKHEDVGVFSGLFPSTVAGHSANMFKFTLVQQ